jgi:hypothetical protein
MTDWTQRVLESKRAMRKQLASLSFGQKLALLEKLRERRVAISSSGIRRQICAAGQFQQG